MGIYVDVFDVFIDEPRYFHGGFCRYNDRCMLDAVFWSDVIIGESIAVGRCEDEFFVLRVHIDTSKHRSNTPVCCGEESLVDGGLKFARIDEDRISHDD